MASPPRNAELKFIWEEVAHAGGDTGGALVVGSGVLDKKRNEIRIPATSTAAAPTPSEKIKINASDMLESPSSSSVGDSVGEGGNVGEGGGEGGGEYTRSIVPFVSSAVDVFPKAVPKSAMMVEEEEALVGKAAAEKKEDALVGKAAEVKGGGGGKEEARAGRAVKEEVTLLSVLQWT
ncbi:hypothetical protein CYMTET_48381 [Cymbomonas tetramitiformis]|uniref:Uncharacterized protein n=1 Tax=Cymbomonas tetramitiformis TaxID=36881 RepID=A0AAE0BSD2_9CHLO|nr:hypothetical protein CYMTET_48381 [Cymbomonas tetramitiformis]